MKIRLALMASGSGTNAQAIFQYFKGHPQVDIACLLSNNSVAGALEKAQSAGIPTVVLPNHFEDASAMFLLEQLRQFQVHGVILAGYLKKIPQLILAHFPDTVLNLHPALLPEFGGKGMYGAHVHQAVLAAGKTHSGITIHVVNAAYDQGPILLQVQTSIAHCRTASEVANAVQGLEHYWYPRTIEWYFSQRQQADVVPLLSSI
jgi:phosphoribosylglycinamide formyltransferase-1